MSEAVAAPPGSPQTTQIFSYFTVLSLVLYLASPSGYLVDFATSYMLKNQLHYGADAVTKFRLLTGIPTYCAFIFGLIRDNWSPFGRRDRGYLMIFGPVTALLFAWLAVSPLSYSGLFIGMILAMITSRFFKASQQSLLALIGQEKLMSGRLTVVWQIVESIPAILAAVGGGWVAGHLKPSQTFMVVALIALSVGLVGVWKPGSVFRGAYEAPLARGTTFFGDLKRLFRHRAVYPAVLCLFLFQFAPGSNTPLLFYLQDRLHASQIVFGVYYATYLIGFIPMFVLYGWLCKRVALNKLLFWGTIITIPQMLPLALIHSASLAMWLGFPIGAMGGIAAIAYYDLAMRSCPPGLQGSLMMLADSFFQLSYRGGDFIGVKIYDLSPTYGFLYCAIATSAVYALILPVLLLAPKDIISTRDGEVNPGIEAAAAAAPPAA
ncbi:MAG TPA: MFS transporter [Caulobacteraceae bacterium]